MNQARALIIAGPNGAGKTSFSREFLPREGHCPTYINADLIAAGLSPFDPTKSTIQAAKLMIQAIDNSVQARQDFAVETTLSGRSYIGMISAWKRSGFQVGIIFLRLPSVELAVNRVRLRVLQGGHHVEESVIRRRFTNGWKNFTEFYQILADDWRLYDASQTPPNLIAVKGPT